MRKSRSPIRGGNILPIKPVVILPKYRVVRTVIRAEKVTVRAASVEDALRKVDAFGGFKHWPAHGSDGEQVGEWTVERVLATRKRADVEETTLGKPAVRPPDANAAIERLRELTESERGDHD